MEAIRFYSAKELMSGRLPNGAESCADVALWFYPRDGVEDAGAGRALADAAENILLIPGTGADSALRRPELVQRFAELGFVPDYDCDLDGVEPTALRLVRAAPPSAEVMVPAVESAFAAPTGRGLNAARTRMSELEAADLHISKLEEAPEAKGGETTANG